MRDVAAGDVLTAQYSTLARAGVSAAAVQTWNPQLRRTTRILVPMDVQALVVTAGGEPDAQVLSQLPDPAPDASGSPPGLPKIAPFTDGPPRAPGVYLHWAAADGLAAAQAQAPGAAAVAGGLPAQPFADRWLVVRLAGGTPRQTRAWVVEAERGRTADLASWSETSGASGGRTPNFPSEKLTATAGGDPAWTAVYDTSEDRFGMHDPLDDLERRRPGRHGQLPRLRLVVQGRQRPAVRGEHRRPGQPAHGAQLVVHGVGIRRPGRA